MRRTHHVALLVLAALAPAWMLVNAAPVATPRIAAISPAVEVSPNGEYLIQFAPKAAQRSMATQRLDAVGIELTGTAVNLPISLATLTPEQATAVASMPGVVAITPNSEVHASVTQPSPPWGLDRTDQTDLPLDQSFTYSATAGAGTTIYIIDSGINAAHVEFTGRLLPGVDEIGDGNGTNDCKGHGTHVSGIAGGTTYGIAKLATLVPVRVLDCMGSGSLFGVINGIDWVITNHTSGRAVANLSLGGDQSDMVDEAVAELFADGVAVAVAAGNEQADACSVSPAAAPNVLTVGSTTKEDARSTFSNYGTCLDLFAPGGDNLLSGIPSAWIGSPTATNTISGTSMASPHVAGALAVLWTDNPGLTATQVQQLLVARAVPNRLSDVGLTSPNLLLHLSPPFVTIAGQANAGVEAQRCLISPLC